MKSEAELLHFFELHLKQKLDPLEEYRKDKLRQAKRILLAIIPCIILVVVGVLQFNPVLVFVSFFLILYFIGKALQIFFKMVSQLKKQFKYLIIPDLLSFLFDSYEYIPNQKIAKSVLEKSMLFSNTISSIEGEDFMRFKIGDSNIMFCETKVLSSNGYIVYKGIFISASFNKHFSSKTFVLPDSVFKFFKNFKRQHFNDLQKVKLEDIEFEKEFLVLSSDQIESRYILTTSLMQRILNYKRKYKKEISFSFVENRLYCIMPKFINLFEPALFEPFNFDLIVRSYYPLKLYTDIVNDLNLNLKIWSKQ